MKRGTVDSKVTLSSYYRERPRPNTNTFLFSFCLTFLTVTVMLLALDLASKCSTLWYRLWCLCSPSFRNNDKQTELDLVEVRPASAAHFLVSNPNVVSVFGFPLPITSFIRIFVTTFCRRSIHRSTSPSHLIEN